ncbi:MAG TPA: MFS transporter [Candidatus Methanoperedens sp.]|nr:MFS transporter [Candidatus Methanoperedens sp.]
MVPVTFGNKNFIGAYWRDHKVLYIVSLMVLFWSLFDGIVSFVTPILIENHGYSKTAIGFIIASSSFAGAIFDFVISKTLKNTYYIRLFLILFLVCFSYPLLLWSANNIFLFLFCMTLWGLYYDVFNFGLFDFVSHNSTKDEHCQSFGVITIFKSVGYLIAPIIASLLISEQIVTATPMVYSFLFLVIAAIFFVVLSTFSSHHGFHQGEEAKRKSVDWLKELKMWKSVSFVLYPVLIFNTLLYMFDSTFWTLGPMFEENFSSVNNFSGLFMASCTLPMLMTGWFVEAITKKFGKKRTAYFSFLISSILLISFGFIENPYVLLFVSFLSATFGSIAYPAIKGAYVDYITESKKYQGEVEGLSDFTTNIGFIIGPIMAGISADWFGIGAAFSFLGTFSLVLVIVLIIITPKHIRMIVKE